MVFVDNNNNIENHWPCPSNILQRPISKLYSSTVLCSIAALSLVLLSFHMLFSKC